MITKQTVYDLYERYQAVIGQYAQSRREYEELLIEYEEAFRSVLDKYVFNSAYSKLTAKERTELINKEIDQTHDRLYFRLRKKRKEIQLQELEIQKIDMERSLIGLYLGFEKVEASLT